MGDAAHKNPNVLSMWGEIFCAVRLRSLNMLAEGVEYVSKLRDGRRLSKAEHRSLTCMAHRPQVRVPRPPIGRSKSVTSFGNRKPSATASGVAAAGRIERDAHNASLVAQCDVARHAIWQSGVNHPDNVVRNDNGSTIGTSHADLQGRSNLSFAKPRGAAMHSLRNNSGKHNVRSS